MLRPSQFSAAGTVVLAPLKGVSTRQAERAAASGIIVRTRPITELIAR